MALANRKIGYGEVVTRDLHFSMNRETVVRHWFNNDPFRDECLNEHWFTSLPHAQVVIEAWRREYNEERPKKSLGGMTPSVYARQLAEKAVKLPLDSKAGCY